MSQLKVKLLPFKKATHTVVTQYLLINFLLILQMMFKLLVGQKNKDLTMHLSRLWNNLHNALIIYLPMSQEK